MEKDSFIGLDLGTSKTVAFRSHNGRIEAVNISNENEWPVAISYNNDIFFGTEALNKGRRDPKYLFRNLKTLLGRKYSDPITNVVRNTEEFSIVQGDFLKHLKATKQ